MPTYHVHAFAAAAAAPPWVQHVLVGLDDSVSWPTAILTWLWLACLTLCMLDCDPPRQLIPLPVKLVAGAPGCAVRFIALAPLFLTPRTNASGDEFGSPLERTLDETRRLVDILIYGDGVVAAATELGATLDVVFDRCIPRLAHDSYGEFCALEYFYQQFRISFAHIVRYYRGDDSA